MKNKKILFIILIFLLLILLFFNKVIAASGVITDPRDNPEAYSPGQMSDANQVKDIGNKIIGVVQFVGSFASVIVLIVLGIKYMAGSLEERAAYKKTMFPYLIGAIFVFGITNILGIVNSIAGGLL